MDERTEALADLGEYLTAKFSDQIVESGMALGELSVVVPAGNLLKIAKFVRDDANCLFTMCCDVCGVDYPDREQRFEVVYNLLSLKHNLRLRLKVRTDEETSRSPAWPASGRPRTGSNARCGISMACSSPIIPICAAS